MHDSDMTADKVDITRFKDFTHKLMSPSKEAHSTIELKSS